MLHKSTFWFSDIGRQKLEIEPVLTTCKAFNLVIFSALLRRPISFLISSQSPGFQLLFLLNYNMTSMLEQHPRLCNIDLTSTVQHKDIEDPEKKQCPKPQIHTTLKKEVYPSSVLTFFLRLFTSLEGTL